MQAFLLNKYWCPCLSSLRWVDNPPALFWFRLGNGIEYTPLPILSGYLVSVLDLPMHIVWPIFSSYICIKPEKNHTTLWSYKLKKSRVQLPCAAGTKWHWLFCVPGAGLSDRSIAHSPRQRHNWFCLEPDSPSCPCLPVHSESIQTPSLLSHFVIIAASR